MAGYVLANPVEDWRRIFRTPFSIAHHMASRQPIPSKQAKQPLTVQGGYISLNHLKPLLDYLEEKRLPLGTVLDALGITNEQRQSLDMYIDCSAEEAAFEAARLLTQDSNIGVHAGTRMSPANLGVLGHLLMTCSNAADLMNFHTQYSKVVGNGLQAEYTIEADELVLTLHRRDPHALKNPRQVMAYSLAGWITIARWLIGEDVVPTLLELPLAPPPDPSALNSVFRCPIQFNRPQIKLHLNPMLLSAPFRNTYPGLQAVLTEQVEEKLGHAGAPADIWLDRVRHRVKLMLHDTSLSLGVLATSMGTTPRTLQRGLKARGTSYVDLLDEVRKAQAHSMTKNGNVPFSEISLVLGFSVQPAFQRAFKRWFGVTPGEYRRRLTEEGLARTSPPSR